jgi:hypothetical protein
MRYIVGWVVKLGVVTRCVDYNEVYTGIETSSQSAQ